MTASNPSDIAEQIGRRGVFAVLVIDRLEDAVPLAAALVEGGVDVMELALRTPAAVEALRAIRREVPQMIAGVGTVLSVEQVHQVVEAGAAFAMAPGLNPRVVEEAQRVGLPFVPGVVTPSDVERALELGCRLLKFFPAEPSGGLEYLKSMAAPFAHLSVRFLPLGGIRATSMEAYLKEPSVLAVGGSWLAPATIIKSADFKTISENAREARRMATAAKG